MSSTTLSMHGEGSGDSCCGDVVIGSDTTLSTVVEISPAADKLAPSERFFNGDDEYDDALDVDLDDASPNRVENCEMKHLNYDEISELHVAGISSHDVDSEEDESNSCLTLVGSKVKFHAALTGTQYVDRVVREILQTERAYVNDLKDIILGYMIYIRNTPEMNISKEDVDLLFGNIDAIYNFNQRFLVCLEKCNNDPVAVAKCFVRQTDGFVIYSIYCTNYPRSVAVLSNLLRNSCVTAALRQQQSILRHGLPLESYLLKPVQRILKYHLLLHNILTNHDRLAAGHDVLQQALDSMMAVAERINEMKRRHEHSIQAQEIQSSLYGWAEADLTTLGDLILEDKFRMCQVKMFRHVFLFRKAILIAKKKDSGILLVKAFIMSSNLMLIESIPKEPLSFHVIPFDSPRVQYTIQSKNLEQKRLWCQQIKKIILDNYSAVIPDKAKELVMMLGKSREEEDYDESHLDNNTEFRKKQHCAPEYLERRKSRQKSSLSILSDLKLKSRKGLRRSDPLSSSSPQPSPLMRRRSDAGHLSSVPSLKSNLRDDDIKEDVAQSVEHIQPRNTDECVEMRLNVTDATNRAASSNCIYPQMPTDWSSVKCNPNLAAAGSEVGSSKFPSVDTDGSMSSVDASTVSLSKSSSDTSPDIQSSSSTPLHSSSSTPLSESMHVDETNGVDELKQSQMDLVVSGCSNELDPWLPRKSELNMPAATKQVNKCQSELKSPMRNGKEAKAWEKAKQFELDCTLEAIQNNGSVMDLLASKLTRNCSALDGQTPVVATSPDVTSVSSVLLERSTSQQHAGTPMSSLISEYRESLNGSSNNSSAENLTPSNSRVSSLGVLSDKFSTFVSTDSLVAGGNSGCNMSGKLVKGGCLSQESSPRRTSSRIGSLFTKDVVLNKSTSLDRGESLGSVEENLTCQSKTMSGNSKIGGYFSRVRSGRFTSNRSNKEDNSKELKAMLKESRPGSCTIGERMALTMETITPSGDTLTLSHQRNCSKKGEAYRSKTSLDAMKELAAPELALPKELFKDGSICKQSDVTGSLNEISIDAIMNNVVASGHGVPHKVCVSNDKSPQAGVDLSTADLPSPASPRCGDSWLRGSVPITDIVESRNNRYLPPSGKSFTPIMTSNSKPKSLTAQTYSGHNLNGHKPESFYEDQLLGALEGLLPTDSEITVDLKDNCVKDGTHSSNSASSPNVMSSLDFHTKLPGFTVRERLQSLESSHFVREMCKSYEVIRKKPEKAERVQSILHTLENISRDEDVKNVVNLESFRSRPQKKSDRDRMRELAVCASMTRLRQSSLGPTGRNMQ